MSKIYIEDENVVGIPKFYNEEHDFCSYNLFEFHKLGLPLSPTIVFDYIKNHYVIKQEGHLEYYSSEKFEVGARQRFLMCDAFMTPNLFDSEIVKDVKCIGNKLPNDINSYPEVSLDSIKKLYVDTMLKELSAMLNEKSLFFLSGGLDSLVLLLLAKSINLPIKCIFVNKPSLDNQYRFVKYLEKAYSLDIDYIPMKGVISSKVVQKYLTKNPGFWPQGSGTVDIALCSILIMDRYKEYKNFIIGDEFFTTLQEVAFRSLYKSNITFDMFEKTNEIYGYYKKHYPHAYYYKEAQIYDGLESYISTVNCFRNLYNYESVTGKYFFKSAFVDENLYLNSYNFPNNIDKIKVAYKIPQIEICEELSPGIKVRLPSWNTTDLFNRQYTQTANIMRWFVNYEESRKQYSKEKDNA